LLLYGCDLAASPDGQALVRQIAAVTDDKVAASTDLTGSAACGGDWNLEYSVGHIDVKSLTPLAVDDWSHVLGNPVAQNDNDRAFQGTPLLVNTNQGVLNNDSDPNHLPMTAVLVAGPAHGSVTLNANGSFTYTGDATFVGTDTFTYVAKDSQAQSNVATVTIVVSAAQPPVAKNDSYDLAGGGTDTVSPTKGLLANDNDPQNRTLTAVLASSPAHARRRRLVPVHAGFRLYGTGQLHVPRHRRSPQFGPGNSFD
jgi:VCBS repeat-containing protein